MKIFSQFKAGRQIQKLRSSRSLSPEELAAVEEQLIQMGSGALQPAIESLSHGEARVPAMRVLDRLLDEKTLGVYLDALSSPNPAIVTGVTKILSNSGGYDVSRIVGLLSDNSISKKNIETILWEQKERLAPRTLVNLIPELGKDARAVLFRILEKIANESTVGDLVKLADHEDWWIRLYVAKLMGDFDQPESIKCLSTLVRDKNKGVRLDAVASLHRLRAREAIPALIHGLRDGDLKVQTATIDALIDICDTKSVPHLLDVLKDESEYARRGAVEVLNEVATADAIQDLVRALRDEDWWVRVRAADALGTLGGPKVVDGVVGLLGDPDDFIRRYAVEILNAVPSERAVEHLIIALRDDDWWVRERSIDALAKTGDERAVEPLMELMVQDASATPHCVRALGILGDTRALRKLCDLAGSESDEIQREALDALVLFSRSELSPKDRKLISESLARAPVSADSGSRPTKGHEMEVFGPEGGRSKPESRDLSSKARTTPGSQAEAPPSPGGETKNDPDGDEAKEAINFHKLPRDTVLLDRYRVIRQVGKGGFGSIYLVEDSAIREELILKVLNPQFSLDETATARFVQELKLTRGITHENVIRIYDFLDLGGARAVSMEYFPGKDLGRIIYSEKSVDVERTLKITGQILAGLAVAHQRGITHRDIKPANILVGDADKVKIVDFGLASIEDRGGSRLTKSGLLIGTPEYMAPEQITGAEADHRADIYSLGLVMYEMLSGKKPFEAETPVKVLFQHLEGEAESLSNLVPGLPENVQALVEGAMSKDPSDRPQDCDAFHQLVESALASLDEAA